jgi:hypothetical protein
MSNSKTAIAEIKRLMVQFGFLASEKFLDAKLADGTAIKVEGDQLGEGAKVMVVTADAEVPAPDGTHELEDGTKVETKDGVIVKVVEVAGDSEAEAAPEAPEAEVMADAASGVDTEVEPPAVDAPATPGKEVEVELVDMLKSFIEQCSAKIASMESKMESVENQFAAFKKEPAAKKIANGKTEKFNNQFNDDLDDQISKIMSLRKNNN